MNNLMMPTLLSMLTKEKVFKDLSKKTQILIKFLIFVNTVSSIIKITMKLYDVVEGFKQKSSKELY